MENWLNLILFYYNIFKTQLNFDIMRMPLSQYLIRIHFHLDSLPIFH